MSTINLRASVRKGRKLSDRYLTADSASDKETLLALAEATLKPGETLHELDVIIRKDRTPCIWVGAGENPEQSPAKWQPQHMRYLELALEEAAKA